eukprot:gene8203-1465_t
MLTAVSRNLNVLSCKEKSVLVAKPSRAVRTHSFYNQATAPVLQTRQHSARNVAIAAIGSGTISKTGPSMAELESSTRLEPLGEEVVENPESEACAISIAEALNETKCSEISVLHVAPLVSWTSYMIFASVFSKPQLLAALDRVERAAIDTHSRDRTNSPGASPWECLDFGDVIVHIMTPEQREYYDIESFYAAAQEVDLPFPQEAPKEEDQPPRWTRSAGGEF